MPIEPRSNVAAEGVKSLIVDPLDGMPALGMPTLLAFVRVTGVDFLRVCPRRGIG